MDYNFEQFDQSKEIIFFKDASRFEKFSNEVFDSNANLFSVLLPIPTYIRDQVSARIRKDQSFQLVNDPRQADLVLYLNYAKPRPGVKDGFILYWHPPINPPQAGMGEQIFSEDHVLFSTMNLTTAQLQSAATSLHGHLRKLLRRKTKGWLNQYDRR